MKCKYCGRDFKEHGIVIGHRPPYDANGIGVAVCMDYDKVSDKRIGVFDGGSDEGGTPEPIQTGSGVFHRVLPVGGPDGRRRADPVQAEPRPEDSRPEDPGKT